MSTDTDLAPTTIADLAAPLTDDERQDLQELEGVIARGQQTFVEVGTALISIRDERLYRADHQTFEAYLAERWPEIGRRRAYQLMDAAAVAGNVNHGSQPAIANERQARPLVGLAPEQQRAAVAEASAATGGKLTAGAIEQAAAKHKPPPQPATPAPATAAPASQIVASVPVLTPLPLAAPPMLTPIAPDVAVELDMRAIMHASILVAWCDEQAAEARRRLAHLIVAATTAGRQAPTIEIPGDLLATAARTGLDTPALKAQIAMLAFSVKLVEAA